MRDVKEEASVEFASMGFFRKANGESIAAASLHWWSFTLQYWDIKLRRCDWATSRNGRWISLRWVLSQRDWRSLLQRHCIGGLLLHCILGHQVSVELASMGYFRETGDLSLCDPQIRHTRHTLPMEHPVLVGNQRSLRTSISMKASHLIWFSWLITAAILILAGSKLGSHLGPYKRVICGLTICHGRTQLTACHEQTQ